MLVIPGSVLGRTVAWSPKWTCPYRTGRPPVSAGLDGMQIETICRYKLPIVVIACNNGGLWRKIV